MDQAHPTLIMESSDPPSYRWRHGRKCKHVRLPREECSEHHGWLWRRHLHTSVNLSGYHDPQPETSSGMILEHISAGSLLRKASSPERASQAEEVSFPSRARMWYTLFPAKIIPRMAEGQGGKTARVLDGITELPTPPTPPSPASGLHVT